MNLVSKVFKVFADLTSGDNPCLQRIAKNLFWSVILVLVYQLDIFFVVLPEHFVYQ